MNRSLEPFAPGDRVKWKWGAHWAEGAVREVFTGPGRAGHQGRADRPQRRARQPGLPDRAGQRGPGAQEAQRAVPGLGEGRMSEAGTSASSASGSIRARKRRSRPTSARPHGSWRGMAGGSSRAFRTSGQGQRMRHSRCMLSAFRTAPQPIPMRADPKRCDLRSRAGRNHRAGPRFWRGTRPGRTEWKYRKPVFQSVSMQILARLRQLAPNECLTGIGEGTNTPARFRPA